MYNNTKIMASLCSYRVAKNLESQKTWNLTFSLNNINFEPKCLKTLELKTNPIRLGKT